MRNLILISILVVSGCAKKKGPADLSNTEVSGSNTASASEHPSDIAVAKLRENFSRIYFDYDKADLNEDSLAILQENAKILQKHPDVSVRIEGHADERGTVDYNLALAADRANKVQDTLLGMGVSKANLSTVSYGEEKPLIASSTESAWSKNRRAEFTVVRGDVEGSTSKAP